MLLGLIKTTNNMSNMLVRVMKEHLNYLNIENVPIALVGTLITNITISITISSSLFTTMYN